MTSAHLCVQREKHSFVARRYSQLDMLENNNGLPADRSPGVPSGAYLTSLKVHFFPEDLGACMSNIEAKGKGRATAEG
jgi:hypothetical protein